MQAVSLHIPEVNKARAFCRNALGRQELSLKEEASRIVSAPPAAPLW